jgi:hypothetical protein
MPCQKAHMSWAWLSGVTDLPLYECLKVREYAKHTGTCIKQYSWTPIKCSWQSGTSAEMYPHRLFSGRLIGRDGKQQWPLRSPDLSPTYFYLWGHMHGLAFQQISEKRNALIRLISDAASSVEYNSVKIKRDTCSIPNRATTHTEVRVVHLDTDCEFSNISFMLVYVPLFFNIQAVINPQPLKTEPMFIWHDYEWPQYWANEVKITRRKSPLHRTSASGILCCHWYRYC